MSAATGWKCVYLAYFSQPKAQRAIYRLIKKHQPARIVELGIGRAQRARRVVEVAQRYASQPVEYTGIDLFEAREQPETGLALKDAHRQLARLGVRVRLLPGDPFRALAAQANTLSATDLLLISADQDPASLELAWFYVPRMLHAASLVLHEQPSPSGLTVWSRLTLLDIQRLATQSNKRRAA